MACVLTNTHTHCYAHYIKKKVKKIQKCFRSVMYRNIEKKNHQAIRSCAFESYAKKVRCIGLCKLNQIYMHAVDVQARIFSGVVWDVLCANATCMKVYLFWTNPTHRTLNAFRLAMNYILLRINIRQ